MNPYRMDYFKMNTSAKEPQNRGYGLHEIISLFLFQNSTVTTGGVGTHYPNRIFCGALPGSVSKERDFWQ